jgi:hypothetical protein
MTKPTKLVVNCETGVQEEIELTDAEIAQIETDKELFLAQKAERDAVEAAHLAAKGAAEQKLLSLGLTAEEIAALTK